MLESTLRRVLVIDDNPAIHNDFRKILCPKSEQESELQLLEAQFLEGANATTRAEPHTTRIFSVDSAYQGRDGLEMVKNALHEGNPYSLAFIDIRMPPGWDGIETLGHIWKVESELEVVLCTAYSEYSWEDIHQVIHPNDQLLFLKKPFDVIEVQQLAYTLTTKWALRRETKLFMKELESRVAQKTEALERAVEQLSNEMQLRATLETNLEQAKKFETVGGLSTEICDQMNAHMKFVKDGFEKLLPLFVQYDQLCDYLNTEAERNNILTKKLENIRDVKEKIDLSSLNQQIPFALDQMTDRIDRIATIAKTLRDQGALSGNKKSE